MKNRNLKIKICGIKDRLNRDCILHHIQPDFIGFIYYYSSPRYVRNLFPQKKTTTLKVGVFVNSLERDIINIVNYYDLDWVQLHGDESIELCDNLKKRGIKIIKAFNIHNDFVFKNIERYTDYCGLFLFDSKTKLLGGSGKKFIWDKIYEYDMNVPFFLSGGINYKDIDKISNLHHPKLFGIDLNSQFEILPGIKNINKLKKFIYELSK